MQTAEQAKTASDNAISGLTYVDILISGATIQGLYHTRVDGQKITSDMITTLRSNGYNVYEQYSDGNISFNKYLISWE